MPDSVLAHKITQCPTMVHAHQFHPDENRISRGFELALVIIILGIYLYAALSEGHNFAGQWFIRDDAFYYFKVAQNITEGRGVTFDGIDPTNGYHPLWMLVCIPIFSLARFDLILPLRVLVVISGVISATTGVLLFRLVKRTLTLPAAMLAGCYWVFDRTIHYNVTMFGLETGLTALMVSALLLAMADLKTDQPLTRRQILTFSFLAVGMVFSRLDTIFLALLAGIVDPAARDTHPHEVGAGHWDHRQRGVPQRGLPNRTARLLFLLALGVDICSDRIDRADPHLLLWRDVLHQG